MFKQEVKVSMNKGVVSQGVVVVVALIIIVLLLIVPLLEFVIMASFVKNYAEKACKWQDVLNIILTKRGEEALKAVCGFLEGTTGGGLNNANNYCYDPNIYQDKLTNQLIADEGGKLLVNNEIRYYAYRDSKNILTIGIGHSLETGSNENFYAVTSTEHSTFINQPDPYCTSNKFSVFRDDPNGPVNHNCGYLTEQQAKDLLTKDVVGLLLQLGQNFSFFGSLPGQAQQILMEMAFQVGVGGLEEYSNMIDKLKADPPDYAGTAKEIVDSKTYNDIHCEDSYPNLIRDIENGVNQPRDQFDNYIEDSRISLEACRVWKQAQRMYNIIGLVSCEGPHLQGSGKVEDYSNDETLKNANAGATLQFDPVFAQNLIAAIKDFKDNDIQILLASGYREYESGKRSRHNDGLAVDINAFDNNNNLVCAPNMPSLCTPEQLRADGRRAYEYGCGNKVIAIMARHNLYDLYNGLCNNNISGFPCGDCNHFSLDGH